MVPNFELVTELQTLIRRDFPLADPTLLQPLGSAPLLDGEWLELDTNYKLARLPENTGFTAVGGTKEGANRNVFPVHTERGRYDTQAIGKTNVLYLGQFEADLAVAMCLNAGSLKVGDPLTVQNVSVGGQNRRGLGVKTGAAVVCVGHVSKVTTTKIRFIHTMNVVLA